MAERKRAQGLATSVVSVAISLLGAAFLALAIVLTWRGGAGFFLLTLFLGALGLAILLGGLFFNLVPLKIDALAAEKREQDARRSGPLEPGGDEPPGPGRGR